MSSPFATLLLPIEGSVLPIQAEIVPPLSQLVSNYLGARPSLFIIESAPSPSSPLSIPPTRMQFPAPSEKPKILQTVTVKDMRLGASPSGEELTASGTLLASFALPRELSGLMPRLDVRRLWPDTLVFDGLPPPNPAAADSSVDPSTGRLRDDSGDRPVPPLPDPLPERAFARIRTLDWLNATMLPEANIVGPVGGEDAIVLRWVTAQIDNAPLETLPGRNAEFQRFVRKILLSRGAGTLAGVRGVASIAIRLDGLPLPKAAMAHYDDEQDIELDGLEFEGSFLVGRKSLTDLPPSLYDGTMGD